tara:strand:- start:3575 stop:3811 length:237 start_codon:yes stop_codon:yes gene_type:complete
MGKVGMKEVQEVKVYLSMDGDYVAFDEITIRVEYDLTNNKQIGDMTLTECEEFEPCDDYGDCRLIDALLIDGKYYYSL